MVKTKPVVQNCSCHSYERGNNKINKEILTPTFVSIFLFIINFTNEESFLTSWNMPERQIYQYLYTNYKIQETKNLFLSKEISYLN